MEKRYILLIKNFSKYDGFVKYSFKLFDTYFDLQKHLCKFWFVNKTEYSIFEETNLTRDYSLNNIKKLEL